MFENRTFENILAEMIDAAPAGTDTRQGSVYYDHVAPAAFMISRYYTEVDITIELISIDTAQGEFLTEKAEEHGVYRNPAVANVREATFIGAAVSSGERFFAGSYYFITKYNDDGNIVVAAEEAGEGPNNVPVGTALVPVRTLEGLTAATLGNTIIPGSEEEDDDNLRRRLREKIAAPAENGNMQHYKTWCESIEGVGVARPDSLWNGDNTIRAIIVDTDGLPASEAVVKKVQDYIDPGSTGLGEGVANIGAYFTAQAATGYSIDVSFKVQLDVGVDLQVMKAACEDAVRQYLREVSLACQDKSNMLVRTSAIANIIYEIPGVIDYTDLTANGGSGNIAIPFTAAPVLGGMEIVQV